MWVAATTVFASRSSSIAQALKRFAQRDSIVFCGVWSVGRTSRVKLALKATFEAFLNEHNVRGAKRVEERIAASKAAVSLTNEGAVIAAYQFLTWPGRLVARRIARHRTFRRANCSC